MAKIIAISISEKKGAKKTQHSGSGIIDGFRDGR